MRSKKRVASRKKWIWIVGSLLFLLFLTISSLPSILSTSLVRQMILARVNKSLSGKASVGQWSLGWFSGVQIEDLAFQDTLGTTEVTVKGIQARPQLASFLIGSGSLGHTVIDRPKIRFTVQPSPVKTQGTPATRSRSGGLPFSDLDLEVRDGMIEIVDLQQRTSTLSNVQTRLTLTPQQSRVILAASMPTGTTEGSIQAEVTVDKAVTESWDLEGTSGQWTVDVNTLDLSGLQAVLSLANVDLDLKGVVQAQMNGQITDGNIDHVKGQVTARQLEASGDILKGDRIATNELAVSMDLNRQGDQIQINALSINSDWMTSNLKGALPVGSDKSYQVSGAFDVDVAAVASQLPNTLSIKPGMQIRQGRASGRFDVSNAEIQGQVRLENLAGIVDQTQVSLSQPVEANVKMKTGQGGYQVEALNLSSSFAGVQASGNADRIAFSEWIDLDLMQAELGRFINLGPMKMAGRLSSEGTVTMNQDQINVTGTSVCDNLNLSNTQGGGLSEPKAQMAYQASYNTKQQVVSVKSLELTGSFGTVGCEQSLVDIKGKSVDLQAHVKALDLTRITQYGSLFNLLPKGLTLKGKADSQLQCSIQGPQISITTTQTRVNALTLTMPEKAPFVQDYVELACEVNLDTVNKSINVQALELKTPQIKVSKARISRAVQGDTTRLQAEAVCDYDLTAIQGLVAGMLPEGLDMAGQRTGHIQFDSTYPTADPNGLLTAASGRARFGFDRAAYMGLEFGPTDVNAVFDKGVLRVEPFETQVNQGRFAFASNTDFRSKPVFVSIPKPMVMAQSVQVTPETTQKLFRYMNPMFANLTSVSGEFNFACDRLELPLKREAGKELEMQGTLSMNNVVLSGSNLLGQILSKVNSGQVNTQRMTVGPTRFVVSKGVVQYEDMPVLVGDNPVNFAGRIGLDESLDMTVVLPYTRSGRTARAGDGAQDRWVVDLTGTINNPQIKMDSVFDQVLEMGLRRGLEELFK